MYIHLWRVSIKYPLYTAVSRKVVELKSNKAYATVPKGMMGCGCSLLQRDGRRYFENLSSCVKRNKMDFELKFIEYFPVFSA